MASTDPAALIQDLTKYVKAVQSDKSLFDKSKCEKYLTDIDGSLGSNPAHAQRKALEKHRIAISSMMSGGDFGGDQSDVPNQNISEKIPIDHKNLAGLLDQDQLDLIKAKGGSLTLRWNPPNSTPPPFCPPSKQAKTIPVGTTQSSHPTQSQSSVTHTFLDEMDS